MEQGRLSPVPIALGSASADTEEGRAFFQDRLGLYAKWGFMLSGTFVLLGVVTTRDLAELLTQYSLAHIAATLTLGTVWATTRMFRFTTRALYLIDATALVVACGLFAVMAGGVANEMIAFSADPIQALLISQLACSSTVLTRALAVPSTPTRTFWLTLAALVPQATYAGWVVFTAPSLDIRPGYTSQLVATAATVNIIAWCGLAVAVSTIGSRIIFGLRGEVDKVKHLGQYTLEEKIGEGGMGVVYRASHAMLRRPTAIKLLPPEKAGEDSIRRFEREVQLTATLSHPNTVAILDYGRTPAGVFYYAMEYLSGLNLDELVRADGAQLAGRVAHILEQVSGALAEAHDAGLIHRDIKPANIILCERGGMPDVAKVVDFGLVKSVATTDSDATMMVTGNAVLTGTPLFMAPEAIKGEQFVDGRSDLYALGAVGYFLLTGAPLFQSKSVLEVVGHHLHTAPPPLPASGDQGVPSDLAEVVMRCLAKAPHERFAGARELQRALRACASRSPWSPETATEWWRTHLVTGATPTGADANGEPPPTMAIDLDAR